MKKLLAALILVLTASAGLACVGKALVVKGSTGQIRANPLADLALKLEGSIGRLEGELGLTPAARQRMGIRLVQAVRQPAAAPETKASRYAHLREVAS